MLINNREAEARLTSPLNLINRLRDVGKKNNAMSLFGIGKKTIPENGHKTFNPFVAPTAIVSTPVTTILQESKPNLDSILENSENQIKLGLAHDNALKLLNDSVNLLATKLDDVSASKLPGVITAASKVVESIRKERNEAAKLGKDREVHYHFYTPTQNKVSDYEIIDVGAEAAG